MGSRGPRSRLGPTRLATGGDRLIPVGPRVGPRPGRLPGRRQPQPDDRIGQVGPRLDFRLDGRVDGDVLDRHAGRQVRGLDAVDQRPALEGEAATDRVDPRIRQRSGVPACRASAPRCRRRARPASPGSSHRSDRSRHPRRAGRRLIRPGQRCRSTPSPAPGATGSTGCAGDSTTVIATRPSHG